MNDSIRLPREKPPSPLPTKLIAPWSPEWFLREWIYARQILKPGATEEGVRAYVTAIFAVDLKGE
jgi:hypothetical protein